MWIEVRDSPRPLWIDTDECRLADGELAFAYENLSKPAIPTWFAAPPASKLRGSSENLWAWYNMHEHRSLRGSVQEVVAYYGDLVERGGLAKEEYTRPRAGAGFSADDRKYAFFNIDLYQHGDVVFWTAEFGIKVCEPKERQPLALRFKSADEDRVLLKHPDTSEEYWISTTSLRDSPPRPDARMESVSWSSLPAWLQFDLEVGKEGNAVHVRNEGGAEETQITIVVPLGGSGDSRLESYLNILDRNGFDASGLVRPSNSYYMSLAANGRYRYAHISADSGEKAVVGVHNNSEEPILFVRYYPVP